MAKKKKPQPNPKNPLGAGRKWFDGKKEADIIAKLETAWAFDCPDVEAAHFAEITPASLSRYLQAHPSIAERKDQLKARPILRARQTIVMGLNLAENAKWYLERKAPNNEFVNKQHTEHTGIDNGPIIISPRVRLLSKIDGLAKALTARKANKGAE